MIQELRDMAKSVKKSTTIALWVCSVVSLSLIVGSFFAPPMGEIHPSVLKAVGEIIGLIALFILREAIHEGLSTKVTHGDTTIQIEGKDTQNN